VETNKQPRTTLTAW